MNRIVYVDGALADKVGLLILREIADRLATVANMPVDILTHNASEFHDRSRITGVPNREAKA